MQLRWRQWCRTCRGAGGPVGSGDQPRPPPRRQPAGTGPSRPRSAVALDPDPLQRTEATQPVVQCPEAVGVVGNDSTPSTPPLASSAAAHGPNGCRTVIGHVSTMVMAIPSSSRSGSGWRTSRKETVTIGLREQTDRSPRTGRARIRPRARPTTSPLSMFQQSQTEPQEPLNVAHPALAAEHAQHHELSPASRCPDPGLRWPACQDGGGRRCRLATSPRRREPPRRPGDSTHPSAQAGRTFWLLRSCVRGLELDSPAFVPEEVANLQVGACCCRRRPPGR